MSRGQWEDDDLFGEGSDLGDDDLEDDEVEDEPESEPPPPPAPAPPSSHVRPVPAPSPASPARPRLVPNAPSAGKTPRRLKVKPMSSGMRSKWPDVTSCLLTLASGQQVMFVR